MPSPASALSPPPCLSPSAAHLRASLPSPALAWPCGQPTCTGKCQLCGISLRQGPSPLLPHQLRRRHRAGSPNADGYIRVSTPSGRFYFHRLVYEVATGCPIPPRWHVHHVDGNVSHNCPINLQALPSAVHAFISAQKATLLSRCAFCGRPFRTRDLPARAGVQLYCSVPCARRHHHAWPPPDPTSDLDIFARPSLITVDTLTPTRTYAQPSFSFF